MINNTSGKAMSTTTLLERLVLAFLLALRSGDRLEEGWGFVFAGLRFFVLRRMSWRTLLDHDMTQ